MSASWEGPLREFASLLEYPCGDYPALAAGAPERLKPASDEAARSLAPFAAFAASRTTEELEEAYTRVFDLGSCALEIGWHLYGEDYARGAFLVELRRRMRSLGVPEGKELPDHLTRVLELMGRMPPEEGAALGREKVLPALARMREAAGAEAYAAILESLEGFLAARCGGASAGRTS